MCQIQWAHKDFADEELRKKIGNLRECLFRDKLLVADAGFYHAHICIHVIRILESLGKTNESGYSTVYRLKIPDNLVIKSTDTAL